jgi:isocitrate dehydrogenase
MFEAIHGSAPTIAGHNIANPSGLILGAVMMLVHLGQPQAAARVHNAWLKTIEDGIHTTDIHREGTSRERVGTREFAAAVIERLGEEPATLPVAHYSSEPKRVMTEVHRTIRPRAHKDLVGLDVFVDYVDGTPDELGTRMSALAGEAFDLVLVTNRGVKVWPDGYPETFCTDHWRCRFVARTETHTVSHHDVIALLGRIANGGFDFIKTEHLCNFDGVPGYSRGQGE